VRKKQSNSNQKFEKNKTKKKIKIIWEKLKILDPLNFRLDFAHQKVAHCLPHGIVSLSSFKHIFTFTGTKINQKLILQLKFFRIYRG
jgi:hypothetical protein